MLPKNDGKTENMQEKTTFDIDGSISFSRRDLAEKYRNFGLSSLPPNYWKEINKVVTKVAKKQLVGIRDIQRFGGFKPIDRKSATVYEWYNVSSMSDGNMVMSPDERGTADTLDFATNRIPLPIAKKEFWSDLTSDNAAKRNGFDKMLVKIEEASFRVANIIEEFLFNGEFVLDGTTAAYGYTTWPLSKPYTIADWKTLVNPPVAYTADQVLKEVIDMVQILRTNNFYGPYKLYIPNEYSYIMEMDYTVNNSGGIGQTTDKSVKQRLLDIEMLNEVEVSRNLADNTVVLVELSDRSVQIANGLPLIAMDWEAPNTPNWRHMWKVMACMVPILKSDYDGQCGVVVGKV